MTVAWDEAEPLEEDEDDEPDGWTEKLLKRGRGIGLPIMT